MSLIHPRRQPAEKNGEVILTRLLKPVLMESSITSQQTKILHKKKAFRLEEIERLFIGKSVIPAIPGRVSVTDEIKKLHLLCKSACLLNGFVALL